MYLFRMKDGSIVPAPEGFTPAAPDWNSLEEVQDVLYVNRVFEKQLRLVPRPVEERTLIREKRKKEESEPAIRQDGTKNSASKRKGAETEHKTS